MNIVRITHNFPSLDKIKYGIEPTVYYISREQTRMGLKVHVICKRGPHEKKYEEIDGINVYRVFPPYNITMLHKLLNLSKKIRIDVVHSHATSGPSYTLLRKFFRTSLNKPAYIIHVHGTTKGIAFAMEKIPPKHGYLNTSIRNSLNRYYSVIRETFMWRNADALITNSNFLKNELISLYGVPKEKIFVAYNGVDLDVFYKRKTRNEIIKNLALNPETRIVLYLGGFRLVKGPMYVIEAMREVQKRVENAVLLFAGERPLDKVYSEKIMRRAENLLRTRVIRLVRNVPHVLLPDYYSAADVVVVPSIYDAFPKVVLEAMACGTPVIASAVGGIPELISHNETGVLVEPANSDELAEAVTKIILDPDLGRRFSSKARRLVKERFTWRHAAEHALIIYKKFS